MITIVIAIATSLDRLCKSYYGEYGTLSFTGVYHPSLYCPLLKRILL